MATSRHASSQMIAVAASLVALVLFMGSAGIAHGSWCKDGYKDCDCKFWNGCETNVMGTDVANCGDCGKTCAADVPYATTACVDGECEHTCEAGWANCDDDWESNGCETDVAGDVFNCGACGNCCATVPYSVAKCSGGTCDYTCKTGWANCDGDWKNGCETDLGRDASNCGACGKRCPTVPYAVAKCSGGNCDYTCKTGWANCDGDWKNGCETDVGKDASNCGACGKRCPSVPYATSKCSRGKCEYSCKAGWANCDKDWKNGCETDVGKDTSNCGACGNCCPKPSYKLGEATCSKGKCGEKCKHGFKYDSHKKCCVRASSY